MSIVLTSNARREIGRSLVNFSESRLGALKFFPLMLSLLSFSFIVIEVKCAC